MTIDEAISEFKERAEDSKKISELGMKSYIPKAKEEEQLAEWLEELKFLKQWKSDIMDEFCRYDVSSFEELIANARNKAIDDFAKWLENKKYLMKEIQEHDFCYTHYDELKSNYVVAEYLEEQLKAGEQNENEI